MTTPEAVPELPHTIHGPDVARGSVFDPRIDKLVSWFVGIVATIAFAVGAWFFSTVQNEFAGLKKDVGEIRESLARKEADRRDIEELKASVSKLEDRLNRLLDGQTKVR